MILNGVYMKKCKKCGDDLPNRVFVDGKMRNICKRKFCLKCSPFKKHNTSQYIAKKGHKVCTKCKKELPLKDFSRKGERLHSWCRSCLYLCQSEVDNKKKEKAVQYKGGKCIHCGYDKYYGALEFHHRNPSEKDVNFKKLRKRKWDEYKKELDKCDMVCSNCHSEIHHKIDMRRREERLKVS